MNRTSINDVGGVWRDQEAAGVQVPVQQRLPPLREQHLGNELDMCTQMIFNPRTTCICQLGVLTSSKTTTRSCNNHPLAVCAAVGPLHNTASTAGGPQQDNQ